MCPTKLRGGWGVRLVWSWECVWGVLLVKGKPWRGAGGQWRPPPGGLGRQAYEEVSLWTSGVPVRGRNAVQPERGACFQGTRGRRGDAGSG